MFFLVVVHVNRSGDDQEVLFDQILMGQVDFPSPYWDNVSDSAKVGFQCLSFSRDPVCLNAVIPNDVVDKISVHFCLITGFARSPRSSVICLSPSELTKHLCFLASLLPVLTPVTLCLATPANLKFWCCLWLYLFWVSTQCHPLREAIPDHSVFRCIFNLPSLPNVPHLLCFSLVALTPMCPSGIPSTYLSLSVYFLDR